MSTLAVRPLDLMFNACVQTITKIVWPQWFDVGPDAPDTLEKLKAEYASRKRITVWDGACDKTIFDDPQINQMFRAWHDFCHLVGDFEFTPEGEHKAALMQCSHIKHIYGDGDTGRWFQKIVMAEVVGQVQYERLHGQFPDDQMQFIKAYLNLGPATALAATF